MCFYLQCRYAEPCRDLLLHDVGLYILNQSSFSILILVNMNFYWGLLFLAKFCSFISTAENSIGLKKLNQECVRRIVDQKAL